MTSVNDAGLIIVDEIETRGRPRTHFTNRASTGDERKQAHRAMRAKIRMENIAVLDFETDPFDADNNLVVRPFAACLYSDNFEPIIIWDENYDTFVDKVMIAIETLPEPYMIYAHNGGKFDYMFLMHKLRGAVSFKGRGIMSARIGAHELRDSFHILPERLAAFHKEEFDYEKMRKEKRNTYKEEIIDYLVSDCRYLLQLIQGFVGRYGFKLSIGMAAMASLKKHYNIGRLADLTDASLRPFFFGGRVECLAGRGHWQGNYKVYDVNSMYPAVMANYKHPISSNYEKRRKGGIKENTVFVEVECRNWGALVSRTENNETSALKDVGVFLTTKYEFEAALDLGLIDHVNLISCIDNEELTDFSKHVLPAYEARQQTKDAKKLLKEAGGEDTPEWWDLVKDDLYNKYFLNTGYGKFAQNPRRFKEWYITNPDDPSPEGFENSPLPEFRDDRYAMWSRPAPRQTFNNVGTAASITGAARAVLMRAIANSVDPLYCDTDSLICKELNNTEIHNSKLGAWKLEREINEIIINGKKLYAYRYLERDGQLGKPVVKSKGASGVSWDDMIKMQDGAILPFVNKAPTLDRTGRQYYMTRNLRATVAPMQPRKERFTA